jgi:alpha-beta hydrolase superfamily lysophospholipase
MSRESEARSRAGASRRMPAAASCVAMLALSGCALVARHYMDTRALPTGPNGPETPQSVGIPFERVAIPSGARHLDSYFVAAPARCEDPPVILIYHGIKETISLWVKAQKFLYDHCVSSVVFDPTGSGDSSRPAHFDAVAEDAVAAYRAARAHFPNTRVFVMGHSMGNGPMLRAVPSLKPAPSGVIVASAFASLRAAGLRAGGSYATLAKLSPDWWNNVKSIRRVTVPVLVVHSRADQVNPVGEGQEIYAAANQPKTLALLDGFSHNSLYGRPAETWWGPVLAFASAGQRTGQK